MFWEGSWGIGCAGAISHVVMIGGDLSHIDDIRVCDMVYGIFFKLMSFGISIYGWVDLLPFVWGKIGPAHFIQHFDNDFLKVQLLSPITIPCIINLHTSEGGDQI